MKKLVAAVAAISITFIMALFLGAHPRDRGAEGFGGTSSANTQTVNVAAPAKTTEAAATATEPAAIVANQRDDARSAPAVNRAPATLYPPSATEVRAQCLEGQTGTGGVNAPASGVAETRPAFQDRGLGPRADGQGETVGRVTGELQSS